MNAALADNSRWGNQREHKREAVASGSYRPVEAGEGRWAHRQSVEGRLWDVLWMARWAAKRNPGKDLVFYTLRLEHGRKRNATLKMTSGPGDDWEPVITIMLPNED